MPDLLLGLDVGTTATKAIVLHPRAGVLAEASAVTTLESPRPGWAEEDPEQWWRNVCRLVPEVLAKAGANLASIRAVGVSGMVPALVCLDEAGRPVRPSIQQNDARAVQEIALLRETLPASDMLRRTGAPITQQSIGPKLLWLRRHEPATLARTCSICGSYDFIARRLAGGDVVEANWALESGLYDLDAATWAGDLCEAAGVERSWLGSIRRSSDKIGEVHARDLPGLSGATVVTGCADHVASAFAAGLVTPGDLVVELGGAGNILVASPRPMVDERLYLDFHVIPGLFVLNGCMASTGSLLRWFQRELAGNAAIETLDSEAAAAGIGAGGVVALPYFLGEKTPLNDVLARGVFAGLHLGHTRGHLFRALLEGVAYALQHHVEVLNELGIRPTRVRLTGGGARSWLWRRIIADVLNLPVERVELGSGAALGGAFAAGIGTGLISDWADIASLVRVGDRIDPDPANRGRYREMFDIYRSLYPAIADHLHALARLSLARGAGEP